MGASQSGRPAARQTGAGGSGRPVRPSVVVASRQASRQLMECIAALRPQCEALAAEIVVARDPDAGPVEDLASIAGLRVVAGPAGASIPVLRGLGLAAATGDPVALTEDHLLPKPDWLVSLLEALTPGWDAVGGAMVNRARGRLVDWAAYFSDYGFYSIARPEPGDPPLLTDANVAYRRVVVPQVAAWAQEGSWENVVHDRLAAAGHRLRFERTAQVEHGHRYRLGEFLRNRFRHGFDYARSRMAEFPGTSRLTRALTAPLLAPVLFTRVARASWREAPVAFWAAAPITLALFGAWAVGEAVGYARAPAVAESHRIRET